MITAEGTSSMSIYSDTAQAGYQPTIVISYIEYDLMNDINHAIEGTIGKSEGTV